MLGPEWTHERLKRLIGSGERRINLPQPLPIHLVYNTHVVGADGQLTPSTTSTASTAWCGRRSNSAAEMCPPHGGHRFATIRR